MHRTAIEKLRAMPLTFGEFTIDPEAYELRQNGTIVGVEPRVFDLILHLASHTGLVISRDALIDAVWKGRIVSDATISTCVKNARKALGDAGNSQSVLQTVRGRGYRFVADVSNTEGAASNSMPESPRHKSTMTSRPDPSILFLPFRSLSDDPEVQLLTRSLASDLSTIATRIPLLNISADTDYYVGQDPQPTPRQIHEELAVNFVLDGSIQAFGEDIRINTQLSDAKTGFRIWAQTFPIDAPLSTALARGVSAIVGKLEPQLHRAMYALVRSETAEPTARQLFLEASGLLVMHGWNHRSFADAGELLERSAKLDPNLALVPALQSLLYGFGARIGLPGNVESAKADARRAAEQALELDSMDSTILGFAGCSLADIGDSHRGESLIRNAIDLNPANAQAWVALGAVRMTQNDMQDAVAKLSKGIEISPLDSRLSVWGALLAVAKLMTEDVQGACDAAETACRRHDQNYLPRIALAASKLANGEVASAASALADARRIKADLSAEQIAAIVGRKLAQKLLGLERPSP